MFKKLVQRLSESTPVKFAGETIVGALCGYSVLTGNSVNAEDTTKAPAKQIPLVQGVKDYRIGQKGYNAFLMRVDNANTKSPTQALYILRDLKTDEQLTAKDISKATGDESSVEIDESKTLHPGKVYIRVTGQTKVVKEGEKTATEPRTTEVDLLVITPTQRRDDGTIEIAPEGKNPAPYTLVISVKKTDAQDASKTAEQGDTLTLEFEGRGYKVRHAEGIGGAKGSIVTRHSKTNGIDSILLTPIGESTTELQKELDPFGNELNSEIKIRGTHYTITKVTSGVKKVEEKPVSNNDNVVQDGVTYTESVEDASAQGQGAGNKPEDQDTGAKPRGQGTESVDKGDPVPPKPQRRSFRHWMFGPNKKAPSE
jgi:hypothetical protein